jgi:phage gp45-like
MRDRTQGARPLVRAIERGTASIWQALYGLVEWATLTEISAPAGQAPSASTDDDDTVQVLEPYGFASRPPGQATALVLAPGSETQDRVAIGVSSLGGRPATEGGDSSVWTAAGHQVLLDDDGALTITSKDGSSVVLETSGAITITAGTAASIRINVDTGEDVRIGDLGATSLLKALAAQNHIAAAAAFAILPGNFIPNDGGLKLMQSFAAYISGLPPAPPVSLSDAAGTEKAKGS